MPPPPHLRADNPGSLIEGIQWLIWRVYHLDECLDQTQDNLAEATVEMKKMSAWQQERDEADLKDAAARAERRRLFHWGYLAYDFIDHNAWKIFAVLMAIYGVTR